ncbi:MAG TPA: depupylase/deamidase Dop [Candidatus Methylomirabilis sp.]|nr:depupylase/deamidase Dop [Candidatus Methylomirabilis sp.]
MAIEKIMGSETELGIMARDTSGFDPVGSSIFLINALPAGDPLKAMWDYTGENPLLDARGFEVSGERERPSQQDNRAINKVLANGGRLYVDGAHPEYSTPETSNARDLVLFEKAGERIFDRCLEAANGKLPPSQQLVIYKNNTDNKGNSYGYHENYLVSRRVPFEKLVESLTTFLVSRIIFCGAGKVGAENGTDPCDYQISQRADFFETLIGLDTMAKRPIINTRDEPHADEEKYRRLHVIVGDSNMSEVTTYLKVGTTAIVLAMVEDGFIRKDLALEDPVRAIKEISHDTTCRRKVRLKRGKEFSAIELQREYLDLALEYYATAEVSPQVSDLLERWQGVLDRLSEDPMACARELDWVIKKELIASYMAKKGIGFDDQRISMLDLQYHDIRRDRGLYNALCRQGHVERLFTDAGIDDATVIPPQTTRAKIRSDFIRFANERNKSYDVGWSYLKLNDRYQRTILCKDPFKPTDPRVEEMINSY